ncbi:hypothetical protein WDU94_000829 [Cyamophila willieti]
MNSLAKTVNPSKSDKKKDEGQIATKSGAWSNNEDEDEAASSHGQFRRSKSLSRTKKVKQYLSKKIKDPLVAAVEDKVNHRSSWYVSQDKVNNLVLDEGIGKCEEESSQNENLAAESATKSNSARSRSSWYVHEEKTADADVQCDKFENIRNPDDDKEVKVISKHVSRSSLVHTQSKESLSSLREKQISIVPIQSIPRKFKTSKSEDGSGTFERQSANYKSWNSQREKRLSNPFDIFNNHTTLNVRSQHRKSKEHFVIDRNKLDSNIEQMAALRMELHSGCCDTMKVPLNECDIKVQVLPSSKSSYKVKQNSQCSDSVVPKTNLVQTNGDLSGKTLSSEENVTPTKLSYSQILKTKSTLSENTTCTEPDEPHHPVSEDSGIADPLSYSEDCTEEISISEDFTLSVEDLVSCVDFLDLNAESIVPPPCSTLSSNASFNSSLETVISASKDNLEDEEEYVTKVPSSVKVLDI